MSEQSTTTILIVDDDAMMREVLEAFMLAEQYRVQLAHDGESALRWLDSHLPDAILLDVKMPGMDGYAVCKQIKQKLRTQHIPVLMLSGFSDAQDRQRGLDAGADDYLGRPFESDELLLRVRRLLNG